MGGQGRVAVALAIHVKWGSGWFSAWWSGQHSGQVILVPIVSVSGGRGTSEQFRAGLPDLGWVSEV